MNATLYSTNDVKWRSDAWQCSKFELSTTTQISFFKDVKTRTPVVTTREPVTAEECWTMVRTRVCTEGSMVGNDDALQTLNHLEVNYDICCKPQKFVVNQCSAVKAAVYERYGQDGLEA
jgi:hypothetical protein